MSKPIVAILFKHVDLQVLSTSSRLRGGSILITMVVMVWSGVRSCRFKAYLDHIGGFDWLTHEIKVTGPLSELIMVGAGFGVLHNIQLS